MREKNRFRPDLQTLETRWTPATARLLGDLLLVVNPVGDLTLDFQPGNEVTITDNTLNVTLPAGSQIIVQGTNGSNNVLLKTTNPYTGDLLVDTRGGQDGVSIDGDENMAGDITILTGSGSDSVSLMATGGGDFLGNVSVIDSRGDDSIDIGVAALANDFSGDVSVVGFNTVDLGEGTETDTFLGNVGINSFQEGAGLDLDVEDLTIFVGNVDIRSGIGSDQITLKNGDGLGGEPAFANNLTINTGSLGGGADLVEFVSEFPQTVGANLNVSFGSGDDTIAVNTNLIVGNNFDLNIGEGTNDFQLGTTAIGPGPFLVGGDFNITSGAGDDLVVDMKVDVGNNLNVDLGSGNNTFTPSTTPGEFAVGGTFSYANGNGDDTIVVEGNLGDVDVNLGNGANSLTLGAASGLDLIGGNVDITLGNGGNTVNILADVAGKLDFLGGNGSDALILGVAGIGQFYNVDLDFGNGNDALTYEMGISISGKVDGGAGVNLGTDNGATIVAPYTISNFIFV